jgi:hypothetical protein|tara:strand:- start:4584 stop:5264 length:681 start_codon:yes stop_codon:yes gene_type:complete
MNRGQTIALIGVIGIISYMKWGDSFMAEGDESNGFTTIVKRIQQRFTPSGLEEVTGERSGMTVDTIPLNFSPSASQAGHFAFDKTTTYVNDAPFGPGVSDVKISVQDPYSYNLSAEDFNVFNATAPGQEIIPPALAQLHSIQPTSRDACCKPTTSYGTANRAALPELQTGTSLGNMNPNNNDNYTDDTKTQTLAQWMQEGHVDVINGASAMFRPHIGGSSRNLRRV